VTTGTTAIMSIGHLSARSRSDRKRKRLISWIVTAAAFAFILAVIVAHAEPCTGLKTVLRTISSFEQCVLLWETGDGL
jgi:hypothetical protein